MPREVLNLADEAEEVAAVAKAHITDRFMQVARDAVEAHGGIGFTWECDVHLYLKRSQLDQVSFGDATFHRARLARLYSVLHERAAALFERLWAGLGEVDGVTRYGPPPQAESPERHYLLGGLRLFGVRCQFRAAEPAVPGTRRNRCL